LKATRRLGYPPTGNFYKQLENHMIKEETNEKKAEETLATLEALATLYHNENN
jgi:hypothetical protein